MRRLLACVSLVAVVLFAGGCDATVNNTAQLFPVVSGSFDLNWTPTVDGVKSVEFIVSGTTVGKDTDPSDGFSVELDSTKYPNGILTIGVLARGGANETLAQVQQTVLVKN